MMMAASVASDVDIYDALDLRRLMRRFVYHETSPHACLPRFAGTLNANQGPLTAIKALPCGIRARLPPQTEPSTKLSRCQKCG
jgi:hypothetical protein